MNYGPEFSMSGGGAGIAILAVLAVLWGFAVTIFWMYVGWQAMKAHERLADAHWSQRDILHKAAKIYFRDATGEESRYPRG